MDKIKVTLIKSSVACLPKQRATVTALGFKKINETREYNDNPALEGQLRVVSHLVKVEKA